MPYVILENSSRQALESEVNRFLKDGWTPVGGPFIYKFSIYTMFCQAMIRVPKGDS